MACAEINKFRIGFASLRRDKHGQHSALIILIAIFALLSPAPVSAAKKHNAYGQKHYTIESAHFRIHYHRGLDRLVPRVAGKLEELYQIYTETYHITLPQKTDVILYESEIPDAFAYANFNFIYVGTHDYEFNLRGSSDWFDDAVTHEYAHVVSIQTGLKFPPKIPAIQAGYFTHPNSGTRFEGLHMLPSETMPIWFLEGIAQYESSRRGADRWDTHRDMILRTLTLSGNMLSWPHMQVFAGRGDDFEKSYNHGFSLVMYIAETYGYDKVVSILRENARVTRLSFDGAVKAVLGISAKQLYNDWQQELGRKYRAQMRTVGEQVFGRKINKDGYDNLRPKFSPDGKKIYFLSNAERDYFFKDLYSYNLSDTIDDKKKIRFEMPVSGDYDIHDESGKIAFVSMKSRKSVQPPKLGGQKTLDLFIDELPPEKPKFFARKTERQITERKSVFTAAFSPKGDKVACAVRKFDRFFLAIVDTSGKNMRVVYPKVSADDNLFDSYELPKGADTFSFSSIFSLSWSPNGKDIAIDYIDGQNRKIGIYDTLARDFSVLLESSHDMRHPSFGKDGSEIYFSSDETGIFNIYRYGFKTGKVEKLTNVSGGAFHPAVSADGKKLVYTGYDKDGYGIYLLDAVKALKASETDLETALTPRQKDTTPAYSTPLSNRRDYSHFPRQTLIVPTLLAEQLVTSDDNENKGVTHVKGGVVLNFMDPLAWSGVGNEFGAFLLVELKNLLNFIDLNKGFISPYASYDAGIFGISNRLPVTLEGELMVRGIAGKDMFYEEWADSTITQAYQIRLMNALIGASHPFGGLNTHLFLGYDRYDVKIDLEDFYDLGIFDYNLSKGFRVGTMAWFAARARNSRSNISPTGLAGKLQYNLWQQQSLKDENSFSTESSIMKEQYDDYLFHQINGRAMLGLPSPLYPKHDFHLTLSGSYIKPIGDNQDIPSFYLPATIVPGYTFYYKAQKEEIKYRDTVMVTYDTVLVTGRAVLSGELSYRFPLWPGRIDKKLGFIYFDKLYGALNFNAGAGFANPMDALDWNREDWLLAYGAELRLETLSFNNYPMAFKFRWDYGADKGRSERFDVEVGGQTVSMGGHKLGGHRFAFSIGFDFDDWGLLPMVDYYAPARLKMTPAFRGR